MIYDIFSRKPKPNSLKLILLGKAIKGYLGCDEQITIRGWRYTWEASN